MLVSPGKLAPASCPQRVVRVKDVVRRVAVRRVVVRVKDVVRRVVVRRVVGWKCVGGKILGISVVGGGIQREGWCVGVARLTKALRLACRVVSRVVSRAVRAAMVAAVTMTAALAVVVAPQYCRVEGQRCRSFPNRLLALAF